MAEKDPLRVDLGQLIKNAREGMRHSSARTFAVAAGISETSVAKAESGAFVGAKVLRAIERAVGWPNGSTADYLTGDTAALAATPEGQQRAVVISDELRENLRGLRQTMSYKEFVREVTLAVAEALGEEAKGTERDEASGTS